MYIIYIHHSDRTCVSFLYLSSRLFYVQVQVDFFLLLCRGPTHGFQFDSQHINLMFSLNCIQLIMISFSSHCNLNRISLII